jgi:hypothetical protein
MTPLEYMLAVMRDADADLVRRDRMAMAAAPYCHSRMADDRIGKKEVKNAKAAASSMAWMGDLSWREGDRAS